MSDKTRISGIKRRKKESRQITDQDGYPLYPDNEDIYGKYHKERDIDPDDPSELKELIYYRLNEIDFADDVSGNDLDIPGSELDDDLEFIGSEDEENNYYSLGGDEHNDLEEYNDLL